MARQGEARTQGETARATRLPPRQIDGGMDAWRRLLAAGIEWLVYEIQHRSIDRQMSMCAPGTVLAYIEDPKPSFSNDGRILAGRVELRMFDLIQASSDRLADAYAASGLSALRDKVFGWYVPELSGNCRSALMRDVADDWSEGIALTQHIHISAVLLEDAMTEETAHGCRILDDIAYRFLPGGALITADGSLIERRYLEQCGYTPIGNSDQLVLPLASETFNAVLERLFRYPGRRRALH